MKYHRYTFEDFVTDPDFIKWIREGRPEDQHFWQQYLSAQPHQEEIILLAKEFVKSIEFKKLEASEEEYEEVLNRLLSQKPQSNRLVNSVHINLRWLGTFIRYAASLALLAGVIYLFIKMANEQKPIPSQVVERTVVKESGPGIRTLHKLPDSTFVWLNVESSIRYTIPFNKNNRMVELSGEAFFEVESDSTRPFTVVTQNGYVRAVGTSFNVISYKNDLQLTVALLKGGVAYGRGFSANNDRYTLSPGQKAILNEKSEKPQISNIDYGRDLAWKDGVIFFKKASHHQVFTRLSRWYDVNFVFKNHPVEKWEYNGEFENLSLELVLQRLAFTENIQFNIKGKEVSIRFITE
jgi:transmembrane sensor